jgi:hypothetical protein
MDQRHTPHLIFSSAGSRGHPGTFYQETGLKEIGLPALPASQAALGFKRSERTKFLGILICSRRRFSDLSHCFETMIGVMRMFSEI